MMIRNTRVGYIVGSNVPYRRDSRAHCNPIKYLITCFSYFHMEEIKKVENLRCGIYFIVPWLPTSICLVSFRFIFSVESSLDQDCFERLAFRCVI